MITIIILIIIVVLIIALVSFVNIQKRQAAIKAEEEQKRLKEEQERLKEEQRAERAKRNKLQREKLAEKKAKQEEEKANYLRMLKEQDKTHPEYKKTYIEYFNLISSEFCLDKGDPEKEWQKLLNGTSYSQEIKEAKTFSECVGTPYKWACEQKTEYDELCSRYKTYPEYAQNQCELLKTDDIDISDFVSELSIIKEEDKYLFSSLRQNETACQAVFIKNLIHIVCGLQEKLELDDLYMESMPNKALTFSEKVFLRRAKKYLMEAYEKREGNIILSVIFRGEEFKRLKKVLTE